MPYVRYEHVPFRENRVIETREGYRNMRGYRDLEREQPMLFTILPMPEKGLAWITVNLCEERGPLGKIGFREIQYFGLSNNDLSPENVPRTFAWFLKPSHSLLYAQWENMFAHMPEGRPRGSKCSCGDEDCDVIQLGRMELGMDDYDGISAEDWAMMTEIGKADYTQSVQEMTDMAEARVARFLSRTAKRETSKARAKEYFRKLKESQT